MTAKIDVEPILEHLRGKLELKKAEIESLNTTTSKIAFILEYAPDTTTWELFLCMYLKKQNEYYVTINDKSYKL